MYVAALKNQNYFKTLDHLGMSNTDCAKTNSRSSELRTSRSLARQSSFVCRRDRWSFPRLLVFGVLGKAEEIRWVAKSQSQKFYRTSNFAHFLLTRYVFCGLHPTITVVLGMGYVLLIFFFFFS